MGPASGVGASGAAAAAGDEPASRTFTALSTMGKVAFVATAILACCVVVCAIAVAVGVTACVIPMIVLGAAAIFAAITGASARGASSFCRGYRRDSSSRPMPRSRPRTYTPDRRTADDIRHAAGIARREADARRETLRRERESAAVNERIHREAELTRLENERRLNVAELARSTNPSGGHKVIITEDNHERFEHSGQGVSHVITRSSVSRQESSRAGHVRATVSPPKGENARGVGLENATSAIPQHREGRAQNYGGRETVLTRHETTGKPARGVGLANAAGGKMPDPRRPN